MADEQFAPARSRLQRRFVVTVTLIEKDTVSADGLPQHSVFRLFFCLFVSRVLRHRSASHVIVPAPANDVGSDARAARHLLRAVPHPLYRQAQQPVPRTLSIRHTRVIFDSHAASDSGGGGSGGGHWVFHGWPGLRI